tara:strand:- start:553 stop:1416 length:864 start_codon:yes stop_codon:yes gene_type:complete
MSKIKVDTLEGFQNVKLAPNGTGVVEVKGAGGTDGALKLLSNNGTNGVTIKSPAHSAGQSYTMVLPDNNIATDNYLKVKTVTGSGATATGQLEYATIAEPDLTNLDASNLTSGNLPGARFPAPLPAAKAGFQLVQKAEVGATSVGQIQFTNLEDKTNYLIVGKSLKSQYSEDFRIALLDALGSPVLTKWLNFEGSNESTTQQASQPIIADTSLLSVRHAFMMQFHSLPTYSNLYYRGFTPHDWYNKTEVIASHWPSGSRVYGVQFSSYPGYNLVQGTQILLYKYLTS